MQKLSRGFKEHASYSIEIIDSTDPSVQLTASQSGIKDFFKDLLDEIKGFKYQIILRVLLRKYKENTDKEFAIVYFSSTAKTLVDFKNSLTNSFQEFFKRPCPICQGYISKLP